MFRDTRTLPWRQIRRMLAGLIIFIGLFQTGGVALAVQESATAPVTVDVTGTLPTPTTVPTDVAPAPTEVPPTETMIPTLTPTSTPSPTLTPDSTQTPTEIVPTDTPSPPPTETTTLSYRIDDQVFCSPIGESIAFQLRTQADYRCTFGADILGESSDVGTIQTSWALTASAGKGWEVQLRFPDQAWSLPSSGPTISAQQLLSSGGDPSHATQSVDVRLIRSGCQVGAQPITVTGTFTISLPDRSDVKIAPPERATATGEIAPTLAPDSEPTLAFMSALDLGEVSAESWQETAQASGAITLQVSGLDRTCGSWNIILNGAVLQSDTGATIPAANLWLTQINDTPTEAGSCPLDQGCFVGAVVAGPEAATSTEYLLEITLNVPAGTRPGSFGSSITASILAG